MKRNIDWNNSEEKKEYRREYSKKWREEHREEIKTKNQRYREKNREKIKQYNKEYYMNNKDKIKKYQAENNDKIKEYYSQWQKDHSEELNKYNRDRRYEKKPYRFIIKKDGVEWKKKTYKEVSELIGISAKKIRGNLQRSGVWKSNGYVIENTKRTAVVDKNIVDNKKYSGWPGKLYQKIFGSAVPANSIDDVLGCVNERERCILIQRYKENRTLMEIAESQGVSKQRISQIETRAISKIKKHYKTEKEEEG